jgi:hypothetical protein
VFCAIWLFARSQTFCVSEPVDGGELTQGERRSGQEPNEREAR